MATNDLERVPRSKSRSVLVGWLWLSLTLGALTMLTVLATGVDFRDETAVPFALAEFLVFWLPIGLVYGGFVYAIVVLVRALARQRGTKRARVLIYALTASLTSGLALYGFFTLFPFSFAIALFALGVAIVFFVAFYLQTSRLI